MQLNHLHLHVADVNRAAAFYEKYFAFKPNAWHGDILFLRDDAGLDLALAPGPLDAMPAWFHFGFRLESPDAVATLYDRMLAEQIPIAVELEAESEMISFRCRDPDGYQIEVYWEE